MFFIPMAYFSTHLAYIQSLAWRVWEMFEGGIVWRHTRADLISITSVRHVPAEAAAQAATFIAYFISESAGIDHRGKTA